MNEHAFLRDLIVVLAAAMPIVLFAHRLRIPSVAGFLIAGMLIGPHGLGVVSTTASVESLAEFGIVLLLFVVGLELSFGQLLHLGWGVIVAGLLQIVVTVLAAAGMARLAGAAVAPALFLGMMVAHSSTAIVLKILADRGEIDAPHGRTVIGILLIQDFSLVPMVLLTRMLATAGANLAALGIALGQAATALIVIAVIARQVVPLLLRWIVAFRSREIFTGAILLFCLGTSWFAAEAGLSLAIGALIAGLVISESDYSHQVFADVLPFRDVLNGIFFISVGMLVHLSELVFGLPVWLAGAAAIIALKFMLVAALVAAAVRSVRVAVLSAASLAPTGEMAFVLAGVGVPLGLMGSEDYANFVAVTVLTMLVAPFLIALAPQLANRLQAWRGTDDGNAAPRRDDSLRDHVIVVGYGLNGENLARVLRETQLPHLVLELHPERIAAARALGAAVLFGDGTRPDVLRQAGVRAAKVLVVAISDPGATRRIVAMARALAAELPIIVRTRYVAEIDNLRALGATEVIPEEFETSVEIFARVLRRLHVPRNVIDVQIELIRREGYGMLRGSSLPHQPLTHLDQILAATLAETVLVTPESPAAGHSIAALGLRQATGVTIIAVVRDGKPFTNPEPDFPLRGNDVLVLVGSHQQLSDALKILAPLPPT